MKNDDCVLSCDSDGNPTHIRQSNGCEVWCEYVNGRMVHSVDSKGGEVWYHYENDSRNPHHTIDSNGNESWCEYYPNGKLKEQKFSDGTVYQY